jgi:uncharacterized membrane protein
MYREGVGREMESIFEYEILKYKICVCWRIFKKYMWIYIIIFLLNIRFLLLHSLHQLDPPPFSHSWAFYVTL